MKRQSNDLLAIVQSYFQDHLRRVRGASDHTVRTYGDALRLFFVFLADHVGRPVAALRLDDIRADAVLAFLDHVESKRRNAATTRNCRLAAIRSFVDHLLRHDVTRAEQYGRILAIPTKRARQRLVSYLEPDEARAVIAQTHATRPTPTNIRDRALLLFLYNTGARVGEALAVRSRDLRLDRPRQVRLHGKGNKDRLCPIWAETATALRDLVAKAGSLDEPIFRNARGAALTRDGVAYVIAKYVRRAAESSPHLRRRKITPHVLRHSCAVALLQAGVDVTVIRDYLGHASIATTSRYLATNLDMKRDVLAAFWKRAGLDRQGGSTWRASPKLIAFLESL
jgi:site-specific recombinase XerD